MSEYARPSALTAVQQQVISALVMGSTVSAAAESAKIHRSTIHNWIRNIPAFRAAVREGQHQIAQIIEDRIRDLSTDAMNLIESYIQDEKAPPAIRLRAALAVIKAAADADPYRRPISGARVSQSEYDRILDAAVSQAGDWVDLRSASGAPTPTGNEDSAPLSQADCAPLHSAPASLEPAQPSAAEPAVPRNSPCPCGSGDKFKRCCGKSAPPVLSPARALAA